MVNGKKKEYGDGATNHGRVDRRKRSDVQGTIDALLEAAKAVFVASGVDAPVRQIAEKAGVGIGTIYRHIPRHVALLIDGLRYGAIAR
jgi:AcrR family transcriptional regulator